MKVRNRRANLGKGTSLKAVRSGLSSKYAFKMPFYPGVTPKDLVSKNPLTTNLPGIRYDTVNGVLTEFAVDEPVITELGMRGGGVIENRLLYSREFSTEWTNNLTSIVKNEIGIDGVENTAHTLIENNDSSVGSISQAVSFDGSITDPYMSSIYIKKTQTATYPLLQNLFFTGGTTLIRGAFLNTLTGETIGRVSYSADKHGAISFGEYWLFWIISTNSSALNTIIKFDLYPAGSWSFDGVLDPTVVGSCIADAAQVAQSAYLLPYVPTTTAPVTTVTEAGSAGYGNYLEDLSTRFPQLFDALDGDPDGVELIANPTVDMNDTGWNLILADETSVGGRNIASPISGVADYKLQVTTVGTDFYSPNIRVDFTSQGINLLDAKWELQFAYRVNSGVCVLRRIRPGLGGTYINFTQDLVGEGIFTYRQTSSDPDDVDVDYYQLFFDGTNEFEVQIDNISVQKITPAAGELHVDWTPLYDSDTTGLAYQHIITTQLASRLLYHGSTSDYRSYDNSNVAQTTLAWQANTTYELALVFGNHPTEGNGKFRVGIREKGTLIWTWGAYVDFDGSFNPTDVLNFFWGNDYHSYIKNLYVLKAGQYGIPLIWGPAIPAGYEQMTDEGVLMYHEGVPLIAESI